MAEPTGTKFAPWVLGVIAILFAAGIASGIKTMSSLNANVEVLTVQVGILTKTIDDKTSDRYTASDASKDRQGLMSVVTSMDARIKRLEDKVEKLEMEAAERRVPQTPLTEERRRD